MAARMPAQTPKSRWVRIFLLIAIVGFMAWRVAGAQRSQALSAAPVTPVKTIQPEEPDLGAEVLEPGGIYTQEDIMANGSRSPYELYARSLIDPGLNHIPPQIGGMRCPITGANGSLLWQVGGETYRFCCIPCIIEFVRMAKTTPEKIRPPDEYIVTAENIDKVPVTLGPGMQMGNGEKAEQRAESTEQ
ncbi:MAG TPA: hypothetical protein VEI97_17475 [bacterium]|nr:hypothetical protein [bacterium]